MGDKLQVAHILFYSPIPVIKRIIRHTRSDDRTAVRSDVFCLRPIRNLTLELRLLRFALRRPSRHDTDSIGR